MPDDLKGNECGKPIPAEGEQALCPGCMLRLGLETGEPHATGA